MRLSLIALALAALAVPAMAAPAPGGAIEAGHPWIRTPAPGAMTAAGYVVLTNRGAATDQLLGASSPIARSVTVHQSVETAGVMRMVSVKALAIAPKGSVTFGPGGYHLMLMGLKDTLKTGATAPITLQFERAGAVVVPFVVEQSGPSGAMGAMDHMNMDTH